MWQLNQERRSEGRVLRFGISGPGGALSYGEVTRLWQESHEFRDFFLTALRTAPYRAFFWETPPVTSASVERAFECVLVDSPELQSVSADPRPFREHLSRDSDGSGVAAFWNLGHDALLLAPRQVGPPEAYPHLAAFLRAAPRDYPHKLREQQLKLRKQQLERPQQPLELRELRAQQHALIAAVGGALSALVGSSPIWVSTSGLGVHWLHVRLDARPKYYTFAPYREQRSADALPPLPL